MRECNFAWINGYGMVCHCAMGKDTHYGNKHVSKEANGTSWVALGHEVGVNGWWGERG